MPAERHLLLAAALLVPTSAFAQTNGPSPSIEFTITEDGAPTAKPWEKAAIISGTIDRDGKDYFEVHANADLQFDLLNDTDLDGPTQTLVLGPSFNWDRSTREGKEQDELKAGAVVYYYNEPNIGTIDPNSKPIFWAVQANADFARTAVYPDRKKPPCSLSTPSPLCEVQHKESIKGKLSLFPYFATFEDLTSDRKLAYSFRPQFQIAHDEILDGTLDAATLEKVTGGYTSVMVGVGLNLRPSFILPQFEINGTVQLRQRLGVSASRAAVTEKSAERMELTGTYFFLQDDGDPKTKNWRVGLSVTWTEGSDPFEDKPKASTIMFGLRVGRF
ncbi:MAG: hypothetical protein IE921_16450 [Rhodobacteraceae bacterium]|nr:hypothetical protein [Paracoccaceae bacterium]